MKPIHTLVLLLLCSIHSFAMQSIPHQKVDHFTCAYRTIAFIHQGATFYRHVPQHGILTSQGILYLCRHADKASVSQEHQKIALYILCNGKDQFLNTQSDYGAPITILINDKN